MFEDSGQLRAFNVHRKKKGGASKGGLSALAGTRKYEQSDRNW